MTRPVIGRRIILSIIKTRFILRISYCIWDLVSLVMINAHISTIIGIIPMLTKAMIRGEEFYVSSTQPLPQARTVSVTGCIPLYT